MELAIEATAAARRIVIFTGAGMSADSGIGTFRGDGGAWSGVLGSLALLCFVWSRFVKDFYGPIAKAQPHDGHVALVQLLLDPTANFESVYVVTMNVDGLHQAAGFPQDKVAEVHGSVVRYRCMSCERKLTSIPMPPDPNAQQPRCPDCGGRARPDVTLFTESLPPDEWNKAVNAVYNLRRGDVMIVAGTSSVVYPAASLPSIAKRERQATIIEFNRDFPTPLSDLADIMVEGRAVETFPPFVQGVLDRKRQQQMKK